MAIHLLIMVFSGWFVLVRWCIPHKKAYGSFRAAYGGPAGTVGPILYFRMTLIYMIWGIAVGIAHWQQFAADGSKVKLLGPGLNSLRWVTPEITEIGCSTIHILISFYFLFQGIQANGEGASSIASAWCSTPEPAQPEDPDPESVGKEEKEDDPTTVIPKVNNLVDEPAKE